MNKSVEKPPWVSYLEWDVLGKETPGGFHVYEVVVKVQHQGLLAIVKARKGDEYLVTFKGARGLAALSRVVRDAVVREQTKWRVDQWA